jgi:predicted lipoprotein with Yx(FWY)xxD motif
MNLNRILPGAALAFGLLAAGAALAAATITTADTDKGTALVDGNGMTLYVFDKDTPAVSNCYAECEALWPIMKAGAADKPQGEFGIITRTNGDLQWAYRGKPLYHWAKDMKPGDTTGDGVKGVWHLAKP